MAIFIPGIRDRHNRRRGAGERNVVVMLSLTAMVDMFTVLVVFLLQNYNSTGEVIYLPKEVKLPEAHSVKELKPANVVILSESGVMLNKDQIVNLADVKAQTDWMIKPLFDKLSHVLADEKAKRDSALGQKIADVVQNAKDPNHPQDNKDNYRKVTVQADRKMDFLTVKKIMYTVTEAGASEINFAVIKITDEKNAGL